MVIEMDSLTRAVKQLTEEQVALLGKERRAVSILEWGEAIDAVWGAAECLPLSAWVSVRDRAWRAARSSSNNSAAWNAVRGLASALALGGHIGCRGFERRHYEILVGPWIRVVGDVPTLHAGSKKVARVD